MVEVDDAELIALPLAAAALHWRWDRAWMAVLSGRLAGRKVRGRWYVERESLEQFIAQRAEHVGEVA